MGPCKFFLGMRHLKRRRESKSQRVSLYRVDYSEAAFVFCINFLAQGVHGTRDEKVDNAKEREEPKRKYRQASPP